MTLHAGVDLSQFHDLAELYTRAGKGVATAQRRAVNHTGAKAKTAVIRELVAQTGLKRSTIVRAVRELKASGVSAQYVLNSKGGNIRLKYFAPKETTAGVTAAPHGKRRLYPGTFMKGGRFPNRTVIKRRLTKGHVYERKGRSKWPVRYARSDLFIPEEMVTGQTAMAFLRVARQELPQRLAHELSRLLDR